MSTTTVGRYIEGYAEPAKMLGFDGSTRRRGPHAVLHGMGLTTARDIAGYEVTAEPLLKDLANV
jgi:hypothetical protein